MKILKSIKVMGVVFLLGLIFLLASCGESSKTVVFKDYDGIVLKEELVEHGKSATAPEVPSREGYIFKGWNKIFNNVTENMTVYTVWEIKPSGDISIEILDGEYLGKDVYALDVDNELFSLSLIGVVKTHEKASWKLYFDIYATNEILSKTVYLDIGDNIFYILITAEDGNIKLNTIIIRRLPIYTVSFNTQGGSYISPQYIQEKDFVKDPNSPTKTGYTFDKWDFNFDSPILGDITINALWTSNKYKITYDTNGGILNNNNIHEVAFGSSYALREPIRVGYTFDGWYEGSNKVIQQSYWYIARNIELTAKWKANEYMITYDPNGGTLNSNTQKVFYADGYTLKEPTREGYTFKGWYIDNNKIEDGIWNIASNKTLVAKWEANKYQINYDISDELMEQTQIVMYDNQYELITPKREDFIFIGWYYNNILFTNGIWDLLNDITLTPKWSLENITLSGETYIYNGEVRSLEIEGKLPEGIEVDYINNDKVNVGDYQVTAKFVDTTGIIENIESLYANLVIKKLQAPQNVSINNGILSWDEVEGAVSYKVIVNDIEYITTNTSYEIGNITTFNLISLVAIGTDNYISSNKYTFMWTENGKAYINYGKYPQTVVSDNSLILALNNLTETNSEGYYKYDGNEYAKLTATPDSSDYKFSDDTRVVSGTTYYFKVEPIKWRVISNNDGTIQLLSDYILDNQYYHPNRNTRTIEGKTIYSNNYEHSYIREWLNNDFYNKAFGTLDQNAILTTLVDNSASTTNSSSNSYSSNNTNDKIYLLSYQDSINSNYGFSTSTNTSDTRYAITTDYARAKGALTNTYGNGYWWLRSPSSRYSNNAFYVRIDGYMNYNIVNYASIGVRPALQIK